MALSGGGGGGAGAVRAGAAFVEFGVRDNAFVRGLAGIERRLGAFGASASRVGGTVFAAGAGLAGSGLAAGGLALKGVLDTISDTAKLKSAAAALGMTAEAASGLFGALKANGGEFKEDLEGIVQFSGRVTEALKGSGQGAELFKGLSVSAKELEGVPLDEKLYRVLDAIRELPQGVQAGKLALVGGTDSLKKWLALIDPSRESLRDQAVRFRQSAEAIETQTAAQRSLTAASAALDKVWQRVATALAPTIQQFAEQAGGAIDKAAAWVEQNRELVVTAAAVVGGVTAAGLAIAAAGAALSGIGMAAMGASAAIGAMGTVAGVVASAVGLLFVPVGTLAGIVSGGLAAAVAALGAVVGVVLSPLGLFAAGLAAAGAAAVLLSDDAATLANDVVGSVGGAFGTLKDTATRAFADVAGTARETWGGIVDALKAGDLELAGRIAFTGLKLAWAQSTAELSGIWDGFVARFAMGLVSLQEKWSRSVDYVVGGFLKGINRINFELGGITAEQAAATHGELDAGLAASAARRQKEFADAITGIRDTTEAAKRQAAADSARDVAALKAQLGQMTAEARQKAAAAGAAKPGTTGPGTPGYRPGDIPASTAVRQGFGGFGDVRQQFGGAGSVADRQLAVQKELLGVNKETRDAVKDLQLADARYGP